MVLPNITGRASATPCRGLTQIGAVTHVRAWAFSLTLENVGKLLIEILTVTRRVIFKLMCIYTWLISSPV